MNAVCDELYATRLPAGIRQRRIATAAGLDMHVLEAGDDGPDRPLMLLLHGFPELSFSWRKVMPAMAEAGYYVVAPDQRGYGGTTGATPGYDVDLREFALTNAARDAMALVAALGRRHVDVLVGHDFGSLVAGTSALMRPDIFRAVAMMSAPFNGPKPLPLGPYTAPAPDPVHMALAALDRPRKHYQWYYSERRAAPEMERPPEGIHAFLRAYYHMKGGEWHENVPVPLAAWSAEELAKLPTYYVMDLADTMPEAVCGAMPSAEHIAACEWLPDADLAVYAAAFKATGFQSSLNWYRARTSGADAVEFRAFAGRTIDVPAAFISGARDWGIEQVAGARRHLETELCTDFRGTTLIDGAGHWVQQERPAEVIAALLAFTREL
jgi:pimeloyl-ACP methyl ester carboxylesterase